ncbi:MAG TPA: prolyl oligopeptidase family serine peptidase [Gemmatimonadales bacterium]|nr:prolyl oligopeptidase family serine peptidase [Gemmatimonadales bacterium]
MPHALTGLVLFGLSLTAVPPVQSQQPTVLPAVRQVDTVEQAFGLSMPDPFRWMEGENNAEFNAWLKQAGAESRRKLDALPSLGRWRDRLTAAAQASTRHGSQRQVGRRLFFLRAPAGQEPMLMVRDADGHEHVIIDPARDPGSSLSNYSVSPDGGKVAVNIGHGGSEMGELALFDVATGTRLPDILRPVWSEFESSWLPDGSGFFYTRMRDVTPDDPDPMQGSGAYLHRLGEPQASDRLIARAGADDALAISAHDFPSTFAIPNSDWVVLGIGGARASLRGCVARRADVLGGHPQWRCLFDYPDNIQDIALAGSTLYLLSARGAPNRRVLALDLEDGVARLGDARVVIPERDDAVLTDMAPARDGLYLKSMRHGLDHVERMEYGSASLHPVAMPTEGTIALMQADPRQDGAVLSLEGWIVATRAFRYDPAGDTLIDLGLGTLGAPDMQGLVAEETEATSADGTRVPMSVLRPRQMPMDGSTRAIVFGYGGYGISLQPSFRPILVEWTRAGNVLAICHVRGGGENGDAWRVAGTGANKQRGVEDFIACAQELAKRGLSRPGRTAGFGASMGGVLTGDAYTTAPSAWGAMMVQSGIFNPVRLLAARNGANQIAEMGDPRTPEGMKQLLAMDPYQHVRDDARYPPLLLVTGAVDQRVPPWNSGKFGARVMAASPATPVWFRTDDQFGHFATNANAAALEMADVFAFAEEQLK